MQHYAYTRLSAKYLLALLQRHYTGLEAATCHYFVAGLHDNYIVHKGAERFICRVYRNDWRSKSQIGYELEFLSYLSTCDAPVSAPVVCGTGSLFFTIDCPEGTRLIALFNFAAGYPIRADIDVEIARSLGQAIANVHQAGKGFQSSYSRKALRLPFLLSESLAAILPFFKKQEDIDFLQKVAQTLEQKLIPVENTLPKVVCHGDVNPRNFHITDDQQITLFDFDQCGVGARIFEIAKFQAAIYNIPNRQAVVKAFIEGYQLTAPILSSRELEVLPYYEAVAVIWVMANRPWNAEWIGYQLLQDDYWQQRLSILRGMQVINR